MFWVAVGGVSVIATTLFNLATDALSSRGLQTWNAYNTRRNG